MPQEKNHESFVKSQKDPLAVLRHELKGPLTTIHLYAEALLTDQAKSLSGEQKEYLEEIYKASKKMVDIVNNLR